MYQRLCTGLNDKGRLISTSEDVYKYVSNEDKDYYLSLYQYNQDQKTQFEETGTISGITDVKTNRIVFDFDCDTDPNNAKTDTKTLLGRLKKYGFKDEDFNIYFSGKKGFHVVLETDKFFTPSQLKSLAKKVAEDLKTFDGSIYNAARVLRVPHTKHQKSQLYSTPISIDELDLSIDEIKAIAKEKYDVVKPVKVSLPKEINSLTKETKDVAVKKEISTVELDLNNRPKYLSTWKYALSQGFFPEGTRNNALTILAATYKGLKFDKINSYYLLKGASDHQSKRFDVNKISKEEIYAIIESVYSPNWNGGTYAEDSFPINLQTYLEKDLGLPRKNEEDLQVFSSLSSLFDDYKNFTLNIDKNTIKTGIKALDQNVRLTTSMLVGLLGAPSSGKTNSALEIIRNTSVSGEQVAFFSMDMGKPLVFTRLAQKVSGKTQESLTKMYKENDEEGIKKLKYKIKSAYENVNFSFKTSLTVKDIRESVEYQEKISGKKIRLVVIDYLECINSGISDSNAKIASIAQELKDLANDLETCVLLLLQPPKRAGDPSFPLLSYADIKGAATVAQACSVVVSLWREGFHPKFIEDDRYISFAVLKNRMGTLSQTDCAFDGLTGEISELDDAEKQALKELKDMKMKERETKDDF